MSPAHRLPRSLRLLPLIAGLAAAGVAQAADDPSPYSLGASETITRQNNIFGVADGVGKTADTVFTTALLGSLDQQIGRQRVFGDLSLRNNHYADTSALNNNGYGANLGLDWATIDRISGTVRYSGNRNLVFFNADAGPVLFTKNIETSQSLDVLARIGVVTRLTGELGYGYRKLGYSAAEYDDREFSQNSVSAGLRYTPSGFLNFGVAYRHTDGKTPNYPIDNGAGVIVFTPDDYKRNDIDLTSVWSPSGASTLNARLSFGKVDHSVATQRSFSGTTGDLSWDWKPTGKLEFVTDLLRDTGQESNFYQAANLGQNGTTGDTSRVTNAIQLVAKYAATAKITIDATLRTAERSLVSNVGNGSDISGKDRTNQVALGAHWAPTRAIEVGCTYTNIRRSTNFDNPATALSEPYSANTYGCYGQFLLQ